MTDYHEQFERLAGLMTSLDEFNIGEIFDTLARLCMMLRVSKGVTTFYASVAHERKGLGEPFVCYDSGEEHVLVSRIRRETATHMVIVCDVYQAKGEAPLTEQERNRVEIIQRMMVMCLNKSRQEKMLQMAACMDDEGYPNLRYFYAKIGELIQKGPDALFTKTAVRFNLKHFSLINERLGWKFGSIVMRKYFDILSQAGGDQTLVCRLGGDNFVMLFETANLAKVVECFMGTTVTYMEQLGQTVDLSAVAGVYTITDPERIKEPGNIMDGIITAYNIAKRENTDDIVYFTDELKIRKQNSIQIHRRFHRALEKGEFVPYYQPKVDIRTKKMIGAEALCRWIHDGKIVPPFEFIPILEQGTDICKLDFYMLDRVCRDIRKWLDEGRPVVKISVNFSRRHMVDPDLYKHIIATVDSSNVPHEYIEIELTETTTDVEFKDLKRVVEGLQAAGISTSADDFGVGYSSLNLIKQIPWNILKLDKSILPANGEDVERGSRMFAHVIAMAHEIGLTCVAEGVETDEQLNIMDHYGCRIAQGFLFDKPLEHDEFEKRLTHTDYSA